MYKKYSNVTDTNFVQTAEVMGRSRKDPHSPHGGNFGCPEGEEETKLFLIIVNVLGHPKGVGGLTSNFLRGGGMDVFWNDPMHKEDRKVKFQMKQVATVQNCGISTILAKSSWDMRALYKQYWFTSNVV